MIRRTLSVVVLSVCLLWSCSADNSRDNEQEYIVYMGGKGDSAIHQLISSHYDILANTLGSPQKATDSMIYTYKHGFSGFSARITKQHAEVISRMPNVVSVFPNKIVHLHTTRSWDFLGLVQEQEDRKENRIVEALPEGSYDTILGVIDTGLWPEAESFNDAGFGPVPSRWKGFCNNTGIKNSSEIFTCTKKIIGGRSYPLSLSSLATQPSSRLFFQTKDAQIEDDQVEEFDNSRDANGHGTHTSSTATGIHVEGASMLGLAPGNARGGYSEARVAMYKVCWFGGSCSINAILAAFDDAIHDGVDALSLSLGGSPEDYDLDGIAIGAYHAVENGITVTCSAGNSGPNEGSVTNSAPWILTVAASTIDRLIASPVLLGNNMTLLGAGLNLEEPAKPFYSLVFGGDIPLGSSTSTDASHCLQGSLDSTKLQGKIIVCILDDDFGLSLSEIDGATGLILVTDFFADLLQSVDGMRSSFVKTPVGDAILAYIKSAKNPTASILRTKTVSGVKPAPTVAGFSSRGPNTISLDIIKPDVTAPGVSILAAWSLASPILTYGTRTIFGKYNIESGTSMACPHVSGAVSFLKSMHPEWSPAAIKSALMTTASVLDNTGKPMEDYNGSLATPFQYGSGQINPSKAADPGLVYDVGALDYISYLCDSGYTSSRVRLITGNKSTSCPKAKLGVSPPYLNYPSVGFVNLTASVAQSTTRTVTNVGAATSVYSASVSSPSSVVVDVTPSTLKFTSLGQKLTFTVTVKASGSLPASQSWLFGRIVWADASHVVSSPVGILVK